VPSLPDLAGLRDLWHLTYDAAAKPSLPITPRLTEHPERARFELYRAADSCIVNSLHDGMNLVAKELVAARDEKDGVLILSTFAGASRELVGAFWSTL
jgi:trehalose-6-phosphate synthase